MFSDDSSFMIQVRVVRALVLRDVRTRYGRTFFGSAIIVAWPLTHLCFMMIVYSVTRKIIPMGTDSSVFFGTGLLPYILRLYPGRTIMLSVAANKTLLSIPVIKPTDIILARCIVDVIASFSVTFIFILELYIVGVDPMPHRVNDAILAILATVYLDVAIGWLGAVMFALMRVWMAV